MVFILILNLIEISETNMISSLIYIEPEKEIPLQFEAHTFLSLRISPGVNNCLMHMIHIKCYR